MLSSLKKEIFQRGGLFYLIGKIALCGARIGLADSWSVAVFSRRFLLHKKFIVLRGVI